MYQRALQGYGKAIGPELISTYVPALNTTYNLGLLFERQANIATAKTCFQRRCAAMSKSSGPIMLIPRIYRTNYVLWMLCLRTRPK